MSSDSTKPSDPKGSPKTQTAVTPPASEKPPPKREFPQPPPMQIFMKMETRWRKPPQDDD